MASEHTMYVGEALVGDGNEVAHIDLLIGSKEGPVGFAFANALQIVKISNNLGDAKSLLTHPATTTHQRLTPEARAAMGIGDGMVRLSVGLEDAEDLIDDLRYALDGVSDQRVAAE